MEFASDDILRSLIPRLRRFALSLTKNVDDADDLVQSCLEKAMNSWETRQIESDLRAWLFSIIYRQFVDNKRRSQRYSKLLHFFSSEEPISSTAESIFEANATLEAFGELPIEQRMILLLVAIEGLSYQAISETLNIPLGTVMSRLSRARQALKAREQGTPLQSHLRLLK